MLLYLIGHTYKYECEKICRLFFPTEKIVFAQEADEAVSDTKKVFAQLTTEGESIKFFCKAQLGERTAQCTSLVPLEGCPDEPSREKELARVMLPPLTELTGIVPKWGILTGVRPSKLMRKTIAQTGEEQANKYFTDFLMVSPEKTRLALDVAKAEEKAVALSRRNSFSLYISIPFCPSRCSYCSFVSHSIESAKKLIPDYVTLLCREITATGELARRAGLRLETVYVGGGTPTSLSAAQLEQICRAVNGGFDLSTLREFTVEAGRPDTIDREKLRVLKEQGVDRISINPQSFSDKVLENIGRRHKSIDIYEKFALAREMGFENINMDFIAGLPGDSPSGFENSINRAIELSPENITVHTLALKSASTLVTNEETDKICGETAQMVEYAGKALPQAGYFPYYMYRQSKSVGNLENVGWCLGDRECLYNIYMMEEVHTVLACGGGAVSKVISPDDFSLQRVNNFKYPYEYISRFEEQNQRKEREIWQKIQSNRF